jgi:hypothetical protein
MAIKSKYFFSSNCYNNLMKLSSDIIPKPKDMYLSKKMMSAPNLKYEKIAVSLDNSKLF